MNMSQLFEALNTSNNTLSIAEKLIGSLAVTVLAICTVFIVLIIIAAIISLLQVEKKQDKSKEVKSETAVSKIEEETLVEEEINDTEIVAVIMSAISAFSDNDNKLVIRKIVRNMNTKSNWELNK